MDDDARELIERLCTQAGMIMEDVSGVAILRSAGDAELRGRIDQVVKAGRDILALGNAAATLAKGIS